MSKKKETHLEALKKNNFKVGDIVRLIGKTNSWARGFNTTWLKETDDFIGYVGKITDITKCFISVDFGVYETYLGLDKYKFDVPAFLLEKHDLPEFLVENKVCQSNKKGKYYILTENESGELSLSSRYFDTLESAKKEVEDGYFDGDTYTIIKKIAIFKSETKTSWIE